MRELLLGRLSASAPPVLVLLGPLIVPSLCLLPFLYSALALQRDFCVVRRSIFNLGAAAEVNFMVVAWLEAMLVLLGWIERRVKICGESWGF